MRLDDCRSDRKRSISMDDAVNIDNSDSNDSNNSLDSVKVQ